MSRSKRTRGGHGSMAPRKLGARRALRFLLGVRGATTVEYGIILVAVLLVGAGSYKLLGGSVGKRSGAAGNTITNEESGGAGGKGAGAGQGGAQGGSGNGNATAASKVKVGGVGGGAGESAAQQQGNRNRDTSSDSAPGGGTGPVSMEKDKGGTDVADNFAAKRWMGYGLLAAGVIAIAYVGMSMRRAKQGGDAVAGDGKGGGGAPRKGSAGRPA